MLEDQAEVRNRSSRRRPPSTRDPSSRATLRSAQNRRPLVPRSPDRALPHNPQDLDELVSLARRFADRRLYDEAGELFLLALKLDPKNLGLQLALAQVRKLQKQARGGSLRGPREAAREEMRRNAIDAAHFLGLAHLYAEKGEDARALECLEVARAKDLSHPGHHKLAGRIYARAQGGGAAGGQLRQAQRLNPLDREV